MRLIETLGAQIVGGIEGLGSFFSMVFETARTALLPPYRVRLLLQALEFVGVGSLFIVLLCGTFIGMVFSLQSIHGFGLFGAADLASGTVGIALSREIGPVFTAIVVTARAVAAMATELGTMRVTEQIDALQTLAVNPIQYLVVPRVIASVIMTPILAMIFTVVGMVGAYFVAVHITAKVDAGTFMTNLRWWVDGYDIVNGLVKAAVFGLLSSLIGCFQGLNATGGARGVGVATTRSVVLSVIAIILSDYFLTALLFGVSRKSL